MECATRGVMYPAVTRASQRGSTTPLECRDASHAYWRTSLFEQVACVLVLGVVVGRPWPESAAVSQPLGDGFIRLIKAVIAPLMFCAAVVGIATAGDPKAFRRIGLKVREIAFEAEGGSEAEPAVGTWPTVKEPAPEAG
ncbi:hypothetical protein GCM10010339_28000 [Streptomyces alanosinicus]|uniref:Cation:dicarboxylase symporter family transporter n=1 Tax=Streptomyces alanosinicus TaxID=68171 RepID=A0A918YI25_9ACTN|nr:hypothetical protein GCM10010339_28000 [Streptomyces alanosinicus]